jgi:hypothetical protein
MARLGKLTNCNSQGSVRRFETRRVLVARAIALMTVVVTGRLASAQIPAPDSLPSGAPVAIRKASEDQWLRIFLLNVGRLANDRVRQVIRDQPTWESFWNKVTGGGSPFGHRFPPPVDFDSNMVIVAGNPQSQDGPDIAIFGAVARTDSLYVLVRSRIGVSPGCYANAYEHPMAIAVVPKSNETVVFVEMERRESCGHPPRS